MAHTLILLEGVNDVQAFQNKLATDDSKIFSFDAIVHKKLNDLHIEHKMAEECLNTNDRLQVFDTTVRYYEWYKVKPELNVDFEGVNLLGMLDTAELHNYLIRVIKNFITIKRIIESEKPKRIITNQNFSLLAKTITQDKDIEIEEIQSKLSSSLAWDRIDIRTNLVGIPISINVSRSTYTKIKNFTESVLYGIFNLWHNINNKKNSILLLEFDPSSYSDLLKNLAKSDKNIILYNTRRPAVWNYKSFKTFLQSKCKLLDVKHLLNNVSNEQLLHLVSAYTIKMENFWSENSFLLAEVFSIENRSIWPAVKNVFAQVYRDRIKEYLLLLLTSKAIFEKISVNCIVSLNIFGETEKSVLHMNKNQVPSVLLEHGYADYTPEISRFDALSMYPFLCGKIAVWGEIQRRYLVESKHIDPKQVIATGSPRHDSFFKIHKKNKSGKKKIILLTCHPITETSGQPDTTLYLKFENFVKDFCSVVKKFDDVQIVAKLHPGQDEHNNVIKELFNEIDSSIQVYQVFPIIDLMTSCDILVNISAEGYDISTVLLEGMILEKPTMNVVLDGNFYEFQYVKDDAVYTISEKSDIEKSLKNMLYDKEFRTKLTSNGKKHVEKYLVNRGTASQNLANFLTSL